MIYSITYITKPSEALAVMDTHNLQVSHELAQKYLPDPKATQPRMKNAEKIALVELLKQNGATYVDFDMFEEGGVPGRIKTSFPNRDKNPTARTWEFFQENSLVLSTTALYGKNKKLVEATAHEIAEGTNFLLPADDAREIVKDMKMWNNAALFIKSHNYRPEYFA